MESLGIGLPYQQLQPFLVTVEPGSGNVDQPVVHGGEEFILCQSGEIDYQVGDEVYRLREGDSLLFDSARPHHFHNTGLRPACFVLIFLANGNHHLARQLHMEAVPDGG
jgi:uncharacterized cupin superfamily protein